MKKSLALLLSLALCLLVGCSTADPTTAAPTTEAPAPTDAQEIVSVYIGSGDAFKEYATQLPACTFSDSDETNAFLESLVNEIGVLTGWDMSCTVNSYKSVGVTLLPSNVIFSSPDDPQKEEFHVYDQAQLVETVLGSIQKTLQENLVNDLGDPDSVEVYFFTEDEKDLVFPESGIYVPMDEPYNGILPAPVS